jgi:hypothetical protein
VVLALLELLVVVGGTYVLELLGVITIALLELLGGAVIVKVPSHLAFSLGQNAASSNTSA